MFRDMLVGLIAAALLVTAAFTSCSTQKRELATTTPSPAAKETVPGQNSTPGVLPPAVAGGPTAPSAQAPQAPAMKLQDYQGQVKKRWSEGSIEYDGIVSDYPCSSVKDCSSTKYANAPEQARECTCAAPCTPYVVNIAEKTRREETNKRICTVDDWYGPRCPAPDCGFMEFETFRCWEGKCAGLAMGKNP